MYGNLLVDKLIQTNAGWFSLPGLLGAMASERITAFPALRPHQQPALHMFLVQLAALALRNKSITDIPTGSEKWKELLLHLSQPLISGVEPWCLIVENDTAPAFLQPPVPTGLKWERVFTPDDLDMTITSKNHDLKSGLAPEAALQDWIFALINLQTMEGYGGRHNYGIARMNGGSSSRVLIGLAPTIEGFYRPHYSKWWYRDVKHLLKIFSEINGKTLLWCLPWPENERLSFKDLDPQFIEVCRRIRFKGDQTFFEVKRSTSIKSRVNAKELNGATVTLVSS